MQLRLFWVLMIALLIPAQDAGAQQIKLKANLQFPIGNPTFGAGLARLKQEVERLTENAVVIEIFDKSQLFTSSQMVDAVASGAIDLGMASSQQFTYKVPVVGILDQPFVFNFQALIDAVAKPGSGTRTLVDEAILAEIGVRVLWWQTLGNNVLFSKGHDVADPAQLKGRRVAAAGKLPGEFVAWCGGVPVALTIEKFADGFKNGALDMVVIPFVGLRNLKLWRFTDTVTFTSHAASQFFLIVNERRWQSLSRAHRDVIAEVARKVEGGFNALRAKTDATIRALADSKNVKLKELTADQVADWRACSAGMLVDYMDKNGEGARKLMDAYRKLRTDPCCSAIPGENTFTRR
ncbi:MAG: TRAP transporter substrate-binding protein DctP [Hyphomicrobiaceae bacterium]